MNIVILNSFYHTFLQHYLKNATYIYLGYLMKTKQYKPSYGGFDENNMKKISPLFNSIYQKIKGAGHNEPDFMIELNRLLNLPYPYPQVVNLTDEETELFRIIINISIDETQENYKTLQSDRIAQRFSGSSPNYQNVFKDLLIKLNNKEVVEHLRKKFIMMSTRGGIIVDKTTGIAHRV